LPESLWDHKRPGDVRLTASPLASDRPGSGMTSPAGRQLAGSIGGGVSPALDTVVTIAATPDITHRFNIIALRRDDMRR
jgi:hypothetical protein